MKNTKKNEKKCIPKFFHLKNKHYSENEVSMLADEMLKWFEDKNNFWLKDFAISKRFPRQRISEFCKSSEYFNYIYSLCNDIQESKLFKLGLVKKYNAALPIFALKHNCGWRDKAEKSPEFPDHIEIKLPPEFEELRNQAKKEIDDRL